MVGDVVIGMGRSRDREWPHLLQLWGAGLIVEAVLQMIFSFALIIPTDEIDGVYVVDRSPVLLTTVAVLALVFTPALVAWRTTAMLHSARQTG